tara:strand:+ start:435 stop:971 length:537 start_codon:yes stop_codon:yes gene_type:complete
MPVLSTDEFIELDNNNRRKGIESIVSVMNRIVSTSFGSSIEDDSVGTALRNGDNIGFLEKDGQIVACGFGGTDVANGKYKKMYIHSFAVDRDYRQQGLCQEIVKEFIHMFGKKYILYLTVRTQEDNINHSAIRCYEKNGFIMLEQVYRDHSDGKNNAMIRLPTSVKRSRNKTRKIRKK